MRANIFSAISKQLILIFNDFKFEFNDIFKFATFAQVFFE